MNRIITVLTCISLTLAGLGQNVVASDNHKTHGAHKKIRCEGQIANVLGTNKSDSIVIGDDGTATVNGQLVSFSGPAVVYAGNGNDTVLGGSNDDIVCGGNGRDHIEGGEGNDTLHGNNGQDRIYGDFMGHERACPLDPASLAAIDCDDTLFGDNGKDYMEGGAGDDDLNGGNGADIIRAGAGSDNIDGGNGKDRCDYSDAPPAGTLGDHDDLAELEDVPSSECETR